MQIAVQGLEIMRRSSTYKRQNDYIISAQLDVTSRQKLRQLCRQTGFGMSRMIRILIMGARLTSVHKIQEATQDSQARDWEIER